MLLTVLAHKDLFKGVVLIGPMIRFPEAMVGIKVGPENKYLYQRRHHNYNDDDSIEFLKGNGCVDLRRKNEVLSGLVGERVL